MVATTSDESPGEVRITQRMLRIKIHEKEGMSADAGQKLMPGIERGCVFYHFETSLVKGGRVRVTDPHRPSTF